MNNVHLNGMYKNKKCLLVLTYVKRNNDKQTIFHYAEKKNNFFKYKIIVYL